MDQPAVFGGDGVRIDKQLKGLDGCGVGDNVFAESRDLQHVVAQSHEGVVDPLPDGFDATVGGGPSLENNRNRHAPFAFAPERHDSIVIRRYSSNTPGPENAAAAFEHG